MRFLWAFRYNPIARAAAQDTRPRNCQRQLRGHIIAFSNYVPTTRRSQFETNCVNCHQVFFAVCRKKNTSLSPTGCRPTG
ncbi:MAG: hypothetical protein LBK44_03570 [Spirochaetales bacterium]|nr:hypothetical protein [Spirochaetales bacterium]